jgi:indole-3-glycerol phosphate synthase
MQAQRAFRIQAVSPRRRGEFKEFPPKRGGIEAACEFLHLRRIHNSIRRQRFLFDLLPDRFGEHQRGEPRRKLFEDAGGIRHGPVFLFRGLDLLPRDNDLFRRRKPANAENVGMTADELVVDVPRHVVECEQPLLRGDLRMKDDLDEHITEFLAHVGVVVAVDRVDELTHFINQAAHQRGMRLLLVPRASVGGSQAGHRGLEIVDRTHARNVSPAAPDYTEIFRLCLPGIPCVPSRFMSDKLTEIMAWKRREIAPHLRPVSEIELARLDASLPRPPSFATALRRADDTLAVIAEIKRRSPSAGDIKAGVSSVDQARRYQAAGADALSVLTDEKFFGGTLEDLRQVTRYFAETPPARPCLRKDFMVHALQVHEARESGASAILIIVRALTDEEIKTLFGAAKAAGLDALFEIHSEAEVERAVAHGARIIGVNNRDLAIFKTDLGLSERLIPLFPSDVIAVSESGITSGADAARVRAAGAHAILVGEALMKAPNASELVAEFRKL